MIKNLLIRFGGMDPKSAKTISNIITFGILFLIVVIFLFSCLYTVNDTQQAVVTTLGKVTSVEGSGLHLKLPVPIQSVQKIDVNKTLKMELGYRQLDKGQYEVITAESKMITGDFNIVNIDFFVEWKISDPVKYLYESNNPELIFKNVCLSAIRSVVGSTNVDSVLTTGKIQIETLVKDSVMKDLEKYDIGVQILNAKIQDSEPPTPEVINAFKAVETAKQEKETEVNRANEYKNSKIPEANATADKIIRNAESEKENRINEAKGQVARFDQMFVEYVKNKEITKTRMYLEALEEILPNIEVYVDSGSSTQKLLPLKPFSQESN